MKGKKKKQVPLIIIPYGINSAKGLEEKKRHVKKRKRAT